MSTRFPNVFCGHQASDSIGTGIRNDDVSAAYMAVPKLYQCSTRRMPPRIAGNIRLSRPICLHPILLRYAYS